MPDGNPSWGGALRPDVALDLGGSTVYRDPRRGIVKMARIDAVGDQLKGLAIEQVQAPLKCGSSCGSCLPELRRMAAQTVVTTA